MKTSLILALLPAAALAVPVDISPFSIGYNPFIGGYNYNCWAKYVSCTLFISLLSISKDDIDIFTLVFLHCG